MGQPTLRNGLLLSILMTLLPLSMANTGRVERVTVYPDRAVVLRAIEVPVTSGTHRLLVPGLPARLDRDSLRITAQGVDGLQLGAIEFRSVRGSERVHPEARSLEERIRDERARQQRAADRVEAAVLQYAFLRSMAEQPGKEGIPAEAWPQALRSLGTSAREVLETQREAERERDEIGVVISTLERQLADLGSAQRDHTELVVDYQSRQAGSVELKVEYSVGAVRWQPLYEWRLDTEGNRLAILQRAAVQQDTGEDWSDTELHFALGRPQQGGRLPGLSPWYVGAAEAKLDMVMERAVAAPQMLRGDDAGSVPAELAGTAFATSYRISGRASLPGDNSRHLFELARHDLPASISARAVPKRSQAAWLFASARFDGAAPLPPGQVSLFQDGAMVGRTAFAGLAPGAELEASFGVDDRIEVSYILQHDRRGSEGLLRRQQRQERAFLIEVRNRHTRAMPILIIDQIPNSRDERIRIELTGDSDAPTVRNLNDQPGILGWQHDYAPGQQRRIRFGYQATYPAEIEQLSGW
ncbi:MAG: mucoidy inhibitor MuiA family protein [Gammaproteobacteria bacterium]|nr:mucoidy inhibitor MuiA family protein [Gammaproteobacteria bacterium]